MKYSLLTILILASFAGMAQTKKPKPEVPNIVTVKYQPAEDTLNRLQSYKDMVIRIQAMQGLMFTINQPGDITPNQRNGLLKSVDSLLKVDIGIYNKNEAVKKSAKVGKP